MTHRYHHQLHRKLAGTAREFEECACCGEMFDDDGQHQGMFVCPEDEEYVLFVCEQCFGMDHTSYCPFRRKQ